MAFQTGNKKGPMSEINVTPLVDVMLVLLVIFMVTAPMLTTGIQLKLPKTKKVTSLNLNKKMVVLSITVDGSFYIGEAKVKESQLPARLKKEMKDNQAEVVYLRADYSLKYETVAKMISNLKKMGIGDIALVTEVEKQK
jgi:biopolymer transport protein TolR